LALTGDIGHATQVLARETANPADPGILDLIWSSTTDEFHTVRHRIAWSPSASAA
jgi:hypothetical protein